LSCPFFDVNIIPLDGAYSLQKDDRFYLYVCTEGDCIFKINHEISYFKAGDTILIPAAVDKLTIEGKATLLEIFVS
jgi:mannose-6-phosphate isomerase